MACRAGGRSRPEVGLRLFCPDVVAGETDVLPAERDDEMMNPPPAAIVRPTVKEPIHGGEGREVLRQQTLLSALSQRVEQRLDRPVLIGLGSPTEPLGGREMWRDQLPFVVRPIACVAEPRAPILAPG